MSKLPVWRRLRPTTLLLALALAWSATAPLPSRAAPPDAADAGWIVARLAQPVPNRTAFVELRGSPLLKAPLRLEGEYQRPRADTLVRRVTAPYAETTTIITGTADGGRVRIERAGKGARTFALSRVPELGALQASFGALLAGDRATLERHYALQADGVRSAWTLTLTPKDAALPVRAIVLRGRGAELRCIETTRRATAARAPEVQRTLLAGAAEAARTVADPSALAALCPAPAA